MFSGAVRRMRAIENKGREKSGLRCRKATLDEDAVVTVFLRMDVAELVEAGDDVVAVMRHEELGGAEFARDEPGTAAKERIESGAGFGGDEKPVRREGAGMCEHGGVGVVGFIENGERGPVVSAEFVQDAERG